MDTIFCIRRSACVTFRGRASVSLIRRPNLPRRALKKVSNVLLEQFVCHCICRNSSHTCSNFVRSSCSTFSCCTRLLLRGLWYIYTQDPVHTKHGHTALMSVSRCHRFFQIFSNYWVVLLGHPGVVSVARRHVVFCNKVWQHRQQPIKKRQSKASSVSNFLIGYRTEVIFTPGLLVASTCP